MLHKIIMLRIRFEGASLGTRGDARCQHVASTARIIGKSILPSQLLINKAHSPADWCSLFMLRPNVCLPYLPGVHFSSGSALHIPDLGHHLLLHRTRALSDHEEAQAKREELFWINEESGTLSTSDRSSLSLGSQGAAGACTRAQKCWHAARGQSEYPV